MHAYLHAALGVCLWDVLTVLIVLAAVVIVAVHIVRQRRRQKEFEAGQRRQSPAAGQDRAGQ